MKWDEFKRQGNLIEGLVEDRFEPAVVLMADEMSSGVDNFRDVLTLYNKSAEAEANSGGLALFEPRTKEDIKKDIVEYYKKKRNGQSDNTEAASGAAVATETRPESAETRSAVQGTQEGDGGQRGNEADGDRRGAVAESREQRLQEERKQRILAEGTGYEKPFGLTPVSETMTPEEIGANVRRIVEGLKENEGSGAFEDFAYNGNYKKNAGHQVDEYLVSLSGVVPDETLRQWYESEGLKSRDDLRRLGEGLYGANVRSQKSEGETAKPTKEQKELTKGVVEVLKATGVPTHYVTKKGQEMLDKYRENVKLMSGGEMSERRKEREEQNRVIDEATAFVTGKSVAEARRKRLAREEKRREDAKEVYNIILSGEYNDVSLQEIRDFIDDVTPDNKYGRRLSERLPQEVERRMYERARENALDALFTRVSESTVRPNERTRPSGRRAIEAKKKELLERWAKATGNWHTDLTDFTDNTEPIGSGTDSDVYAAKDGTHVIKLSHGKPEGKRFRPDLDNIPLFNYVFPNSAYKIVGYGDFGKGFVRVLEQPIVNFSNSKPLTEQERVEYMAGLGFKPINKENSAFSNGEIIVADLQKSNIVRDAAGNISVIDADCKLHTKDVGGNYSYFPVEHDLPQSNLREMRAYHGSGADFEAFDHSHMGEGEGAQAYGYGTYVTEVEGIGRMYAESTSRGQLSKKITAANKDLLNALWDYEHANEEDKEQAKENYEKAEEKLTKLREEDKRRFNENDYDKILYTVEIPDDDGSNYFDYTNLPETERWNEIKERLMPIAKERYPKSDEVSIDKWLDREYLNAGEATNRQGGAVYHNIITAITGSDKAASEFLHSMGYVGIKYPAEYMSGGRSDGAKNYVVFDENNLKIVDKIRFHKAEGGEYVPEMKPVFYSNAMRAVEGIKQEKATAEQWKAMLTKNGGLKAGEDKWTGLSDWLNEQKGKSLTKQEVLDYIRENALQIEEVNYSESGLTALQQEYDELIKEHDGNWEGAWNEMIERYGDDFNMALDGTGGRIEINDGFEDYLESIDGYRYINSTRLEYTTEGLENRSEIALTVPTIEPWKESDEIHFGDAGEGRAVAWVRFGETTDKDGKRVLVIDEIQSNRHQEGREKGYRPKELQRLIKASQDAWDELQDYNDELEKKGIKHPLERSEDEWRKHEKLVKALNDAEEAQMEWERVNGRNAGDVPDAPFDKNWHEVCMKRMLRYAAENGYDKVAWTKGEQQAERYDLSKAVEKIDIQTVKRDGKDVKMVNLKFPERGQSAMYISEDGIISQANGLMENANGKHVSEVFGKSLAEKIMNTEWETIEGEGMHIGGEGMKGFYDQILPRFMDKYGKKWGVKTGEVELPNIGDNGLTMWSVDVTPEMKESVMEGQPMFFKTEDGEVLGYTLNGEIYIDPRVATPDTPIHEYTHLWAQGLRKANPTAWAQLTEEMKGVEDGRLWEYVRGRYPELKNEDELTDEVFAHYSGKRGRERLEADMREEMSKTHDVFEKAKVATMFHKLREILSKFWNMARDLFAGKVEGVENLTADDFADMVMGDLARGYNPRATEEKTLMGVHNISEEKLKKALKQGGFANPSMAVIDTKNGTLNVYGEISLIPKASLIDSRTGRNAGTYAGDAWTPTYPSITKMMTKQGEKHFDQIAKEAANGDKELERHLKQQLERFVDGDTHNLAFIFLKQKGYDPKKKMKRIDSTPEEYEAARKITGADNLSNVSFDDLTQEQKDELLKLIMGDIENEAKKATAGIADEEKRKKAEQLLIDAKRAKYVDEKGRMYFNATDNYLHGLQMDERRRNEPEVDWYGTDSDADYMVAKEGLAEEYYKWKETLFNDEDIDEKLFAGWTPSGNRRYVPNTVENASKLMNKNAEQNSYDQTGFGPTRAILLPRFKSLSDIRKHKELLNRGVIEDGDGKSQMEQRTEELSNELFDIVGQISDMKKIDSNPFINNDIAESRLQEALTKRDPIAYLNSEYGYDIAKDSDLASQLMNFIEDVKTLPAKYFETKFKRPVMLDEFEVAVVPDNVSEDVRQALEDAGLTVVSYEHGNEESRKNVTLETVRGKEGIMFQKVGGDENDNRTVNIVGAEKEHGFKDFKEARKWAKQNIVGEYENPEIGNVNISSTAVDKYLSEKAVSKSDNKDVHLSALKVMPSIIENSIVGEVHDDKKGDRHLKDVVRLYGGIDIDGQLYRVKTTVKRYNSENEKSKAYSYEITEIELLEGTHGDDNNGELPRSGNNSFSAAKLLNYPETAKNNSQEAESENDISVVTRIGEGPQVTYTPYDEALKRAKKAGYTKAQFDRHIERVWNQRKKTAERFAEKLNLGDRVNVVLDIDELEGMNLTDRQKRAKGWYDTKTGKIYVIMYNNTGMDDVFHTILHEGVAHHGLRELFGENFDTFLDDVYAHSTEDIRREIASLSKKYNWNVRTATEEYMAKMAETQNFEHPQYESWWRMVKDWFIRMVKKIGMGDWIGNHTITENELRFVLWRSWKNLTEPEGNWGYVRQAQDIAMQAELGVGEYADKAPYGRDWKVEKQREGMAAEDDITLRDGKTRAERQADIRAEEMEIERKAKADGTWKKAPNGKPSKLDDRQWKQVRTQAFKTMFGDWEKAAIAAYLLGDDVVARLTGNEFEKDDMPITKRVAEYYDTKYAGRVERAGVGTILLDERSVKDSISHGLGRTKAAAFAAVPEIISGGRIIDRQENWKGRGYGSVTFAAPVKIGEENHICIVVANEVTHSDGTHRFYLHEVALQKELQDEEFKTGIDTGSHLGDVAKILKDILSAKTNSSKVVDENGEPQVVYHGSRSGEQIRIFNTPSFFSNDRSTADMFKREADCILQVNGQKVAIDDISARQLAEFATDGDYEVDELYGWGNFADVIREKLEAGDHLDREILGDILEYVGIETPIDEIVSIGMERVPDVYECYVNMRNPLVIDFGGKTWGDAGTLEMEAEVHNAAKNGYDGVIVRNIREGGYAGELRDGSEPPLSTDYIPMSPNQIKSATENVGTFDPANDDIRFRDGEEDATEDAQTDESIEDQFRRGGMGMAERTTLVQLLQPTLHQRIRRTVQLKNKIIPQVPPWSQEYRFLFLQTLQYLRLNTGVCR